MVFGRSLGAAVAAYISSKHQPAALIIESAFVSAPDLAAEIYPWLPARWLARIHLPTGEFLEAVSCPTLVAHSRNDEIIPFDQSARLYQRARAPKQFLELQGGHNDGFLVSDRQYRDGIDAFVGAALSR